MQGPQAHLTSLVREIALVNAYIFQSLSEVPQGYIQEVDYDQIIAAFRLRHVDGDVMDVIKPAPWHNTPKPDGSTVEFEAKLKTYQACLHLFAMHTLEYFLTFNKQNQPTSNKRKRSSNRRKRTLSGPLTPFSSQCH